MEVNLFQNLDLYGADLPGASLTNTRQGTDQGAEAGFSVVASPESSDSNPSLEFDGLLAAAVVSQQFSHLLLTDPAQAIAAGYQNKTFNLSRSERKLLLSIRARTLEEFALKLVEHLKASE